MGASWHGMMNPGFDDNSSSGSTMPAKKAEEPLTAEIVPHSIRKSQT